MLDKIKAFAAEKPLYVAIAAAVVLLVILL